MCYRDKLLTPEPPLTASDVGHALGGLGFVMAIIIAVSMFAATVYDRPSIEAQQIIQAGRTLAEQVGR